VKLLDFGVASAANAVTGDAGFVVGTPEYLSPEQAFGQAVDARADIYSVGLMAWRMLVGRTPFTAPSADSMIRKQAREPVPLLTTARPDLAAHPDLVAAVARACAKRPDDRPASADVVADELARSLGHRSPLPVPPHLPTFFSSRTGSEPAGSAGTAAAGVVARLPSEPPRPDPDRRGDVLRVVAAATLVLALLFAAASLFVRYRPKP